MKMVSASSPSSVLPCVTDSSFQGSIPPVPTMTVILKCAIKSRTSVFSNPSSYSFFNVSPRFSHKEWFWSVSGKASLTIDIEDPVCGRVVSSIISVSEGNASRQGMLGNAKQHGTHFSVDLQGRHPREWTSGILTCLV